MKTMKKLTMLLAGLLVAAVLLGAGAIVAGGITKGWPQFAAFEQKGETRNTQVINSLKREQQVVLLSLGIQGISERTENSVFMGIDVPGTQKVTFIEYSFNAKLGIEGKDVEIVPVGDNGFMIFIPEFIFIGHSGTKFRVAAEKNGALSWMTPEIDTAEMINTILDDDAQQQYIETNREILQEQALAFYTGIIKGVAPDADVRLEFRH